MGDDITANELEQLAALGLGAHIACIIAGMNSNNALIRKGSQLWPQAQLFHHQGAQTWSRQVDASHPPPAQAPRPNRSAGDQNAADDANKRASGIVHTTFLRHAWGKDKFQKELQRLELEAETLIDKVANLDQKMRRAKRRGDAANALVAELYKKLGALGDSVEFEQWFDATVAKAEAPVAKHLRLELEKRREYIVTQQAKHQDNKNYSIRSPALRLRADGHPNALTNLNPAEHWTILVDETGQHFDQEVDALNESDKNVGKVVALALSEHCKLAALEPSFHATNESDARIEAVLRELTSQPVGIFGFSSQDRVSSRFSWLQQVDQLVRWVLRLLPLKTSAPTRVEFLIEQRGGWDSKVDWKIRTETILAELQQLIPERYARLALDIRFIDKNASPFNGYVDTVANCWGSAQPIKKKLLQHFALLDHCLLHPADDRAYERMLLSLEGGLALRPADWYQLLQEGGDDSEQAFTLLSGCIAQLGEKVRQQPRLWSAYLNEVQVQLRHKTYSLAGLMRTIAWLEAYKPQDANIPRLLQLQHKAACLAVYNHRGLCNPQMVAEAVTLANELIDEDAPQACEIILRAVVAATNAFDFSSMDDFVQQWLQLPIATLGLLNHAKLHSTRGQLLAFRGEFAQAVESFEQAIAVFTRLSDQELAAREIGQTRTYVLFARLNDPTTAFESFKKQLDQHLSSVFGCSPERIPSNIASSDSSMRYTQQLYLRALVRYPSEMAAERELYLNAQGRWQEGEDHPWPLILAYRAWLLAEAGNRPQASELLQQAIHLCDEIPHSTLKWIGCVLQALGSRLDIAAPYCEPLNGKMAELQRALPGAPHQALEKLLQGEASRPQLLKALKQCLPFNFH
ncbi:hypothetical protein [Marinobacterium aestuarii]|uniref:hypothetical protein n=1 Tax=Marinobacterium aestuarii TaxID=1821621 RepID=UPI0012FF9071|nr:hypothetical protein [Marinobacterium aestuarii]